MRSVRGPFTALILDLDNTLYPSASGLFAAIDRRITGYLADRFDLEEKEARERRARYRRDHHVTLVGLMAEDGVAPDDFLDYVHDVPVESLIGPDHRLAACLGAIPAPTYVFTNASRAHAERVLRRLGVRESVAAVFDIAATGYLPKPEPEAFRRVLEASGADPAGTVYVDDLPANLATAAIFGMTTVLLGDVSRQEWPLQAPDTAALADLLSALPWGQLPTHEFHKGPRAL